MRTDASRRLASDPSLLLVESTLLYPRTALHPCDFTGNTFLRSARSSFRVEHGSGTLSIDMHHLEHCTNPYA